MDRLANGCHDCSGYAVFQALALPAAKRTRFIFPNCGRSITGSIEFGDSGFNSDRYSHANEAIKDSAPGSWQTSYQNHVCMLGSAYSIYVGLYCSLLLRWSESVLPASQHMHVCDGDYVVAIDPSYVAAASHIAAIAMTLEST